MTGAELVNHLARMSGDELARPVCVMEVIEGVTHVTPIAMCVLSQLYDGEWIWIIPNTSERKAPKWL